MSATHLMRSIALLSLFCCLSLAFIKKREYKTFEYEVPLDHFNFAQNTTFKIRYLLNDSYWDKQDGPIFFYTGNEGSIELFAEHTGFLWEIAPEFKALIVFAEHRYYGKSLPFGNKSLTTPSYSGYLTSTQVLADYADLLTSLQKAQGTKSPVVAFGGSYGGMLAAYMRMKYPHIINGAIAASAPILQFEGIVPCDAFSRIATSTFNAESSACSNNIRKSWAVIRNITNTPEGRAWLSKEWKLCQDLRGANDTDALITWLASVYPLLAMMNYPYECDFMAPLPAYPVRQFCYYLRNQSLTGKPLLQALYPALSVFTNYTRTTKCVDYLGSAYSDDLGDKGWDFQACTEMVMPYCSTGKNDMFESIPWNESEFTSNCQKKWGIKPSYNLAEIIYGGKNIAAASNIVFSNGLLDPWASGGVLKNYSETIQAVLIPEGAHHLDLMASNKKDPFSVKWARSVHKAAIQNWIN